MFFLIVSWIFTTPTCSHSPKDFSQQETVYMLCAVHGAEICQFVAYNCHCPQL